ncbi:MAG: hypothetical protein J5I94_24725, partial [Phaeodactylibacter sp.]|nr:hypothetical protein [Phaeodactylibacter sp.]
MKVLYFALFFILLHGIAHAQCEDFSLTVGNVQPPSCPNSADGAIGLSVAGAQGAVNYAWSEAGLITPTIDGLAPGTYSVTATDDAGCQAVETVVLAAAVVADAGPDVEAACGTGPMTIGGVGNTEIYFSGDITPIEFSDSNQELITFDGISGEVGSSPSPSGFNPNSNNLIAVVGSVTANAGDRVCLPVQVYNFDDVVGAFFTINYDTNVLEFIEIRDISPDIPNLALNANFSYPGQQGNTTPPGFITMNWFDQALSPSFLIDGTSLFTLCFKVKDNPPPASTTSPNITYQWTGPNNFTSTEPFPQISQSGAYTLRVTDTSQPNCWAEDEVEVRFLPDSIGVELRDTLIPCLEQPVTLRPIVSGGAGPYTYQWNNGATSDSIFLAASEIPAAYSVTVTSAEGCSGIGSGEVTVADNPPPAARITLDQIPYCAGSGASLVIGANGQGGQPPYTYVWRDGVTTANRNRTFPPFSATTTYFVDVIDSNGCLSVNGTDSITVVVNPSPSLDLGPDYYLCTPEQVFLSGPSGAASYSWSDGQATQTIVVQPLQTTTYYLTITNSFGCTASDDVVIHIGLQNLDTTPPICNDNDTPLDLSDDTFTFQAAIDGNPGGSWVSNLGPTGAYGQAVTFGPFPVAAGDVTLTVVDALEPSCNTTTVVPAPPPCSAGPPCDIQAIVQEIVCNDNSTPADTTDDTFILEILVSGGPGGSWVEDSSGLSGDYGVPFTFGPYPADYGHVGLIFRDADDPSCRDLFGLYTPVPCIIDCQDNPMSIFIDIAGNRCAGDLDGIAVANVTGGGGSYAYEWSNGATELFLSNLPGGEYFLTVTDLFGCTAMDSATVPEPPPLNLDFQMTPVSCRGGDDGSVAVFVTGGTPPYSYFWEEGGTTAILDGLSAGTYSVTVTDANNCSINGQVEVTEPADGIALTIDIVQQPTCPGSNDGILFANASGGAPTYEYAWSTGFFGPTHPDLAPGFYTVIVTGAGGCSIQESIQLEALLVAEAGPDQTLDCNNPTVTLDGGLSTTGPDTEYEWTGPGGTLSTQLTVEVSEPGFYILEVTDTGQPDCSAADTVLVLADTDVPVINIAPDYASCDSTILYFPPSPILIAEWTLPGGGTSSEPLLEITESGTYILTVTNVENGCSSIDSVSVSIDPTACATLKGRLVRDTLFDCLPTATEPGLQNWLMVIEGNGEVYYAVTQPGGYYEQSVPLGDYEVYPLIPGPLWLPCQDSYPVSLQQPGEMAMLDIPVKEQQPCPELTVDFSMPLLRRCWNRSLHFNYCNDGTAPAEDAYVVVTLDDFFTFQSATAPLLSQAGNQYTFGIGDLAPGQCGNFIVQVQVSCDALVGQTLCAEAKIFPNAPCFPPSPNWSGASLRVEGACEGGEVQFRVENTGSGDMPAPRPCIVIEDGVMLLVAPDSIRLNSGEAFTYSFPANGSTYRIEVEQEPFHPGLSMPVAVLEGCGTNANGSFSTGFVNQLALDDA